mgnify:CR=1 FL=1
MKHDKSQAVLSVVFDTSDDATESISSKDIRESLSLLFGNFGASGSSASKGQIRQLPTAFDVPKQSSLTGKSGSLLSDNDIWVIGMQQSCKAQ